MMHNICIKCSSAQVMDEDSELDTSMTISISLYVSSV